MVVRFLSAILALGLFAAPVAAATLIDFTDTAIWSGKNATASASQDYGAFAVSLATNPAGRLNFTQGFDGPAPAGYCLADCGALACLSDGLGIVDDEIGGTEVLTVSFSRAVSIAGLHFLDLFRAPGGTARESVLVGVNGCSTLAFDAIAQSGADGGHLFAALDLGPVTSLSFRAGPGNDSFGNPGFALAGVEVAAVPVPAAAALLLTAPGGLGMVARRRRRPMP